MSSIGGIFIEPNTGNIGIGTYIPQNKLHVFTDSIKTKNIIIDILDGTAPTRAAPSAKFLKDTYNYSTNGVYWIKPNSFGFPFLTYCDFTTEGGGWTCYRSSIYENRNFTNSLGYTVTHYSSNAVFFNPELFTLRASIILGLKASTYPEFLMYISNDGSYDAHSLNNYVVVKPNSSAQNFLTNTGDQIGGIPTYGKIRGYNVGAGGLGSGYTVNWWYNTSYEPHIDAQNAGIPNSVSSEDNFGYFGSINSSHYTAGQYRVCLIR